MIRTPKLLLELSPYNPSSSFLSTIRAAALDGKKLSDVESAFENEAVRCKDNITTADTMLVDIKPITDHQLENINISGVPSYEYVDGTFVISTNNILQLLKLYVILYKAQFKGASKYKLDQIRLKITELGELPIVAAVAPSEIMVLEEGTLYIKELGQVIDLRIPYQNSGQVLNHEVNTEEILDAYIVKYITAESDPLIHQALKEELFSTAGSYDLSEIYSAIGETYVPVDPENLYSFSLTTNQKTLLKNDLTIGVSIAAMAHRLFNRGEYVDTQGHLKSIGKYLDAFREMKGHNSSLKYLSEQTDVNFGYAIADSLVPLPTHAAVVARFLNAFEHIATYLHTATLSTNERNFNAFKWFNVIKSPLQLVSIIDKGELVYEAQSNGTYSLTLSKGGEVHSYNLAFTRPSLGASFEELFNIDMNLVRTYFDDVLGITDALYYIKNGGNFRITMEQDDYVVETTSFNLARFTRSFVNKRDSKIQTKL